MGAQATICKPLRKAYQGAKTLFWRPVNYLFRKPAYRAASPHTSLRGLENIFTNNQYVPEIKTRLITNLANRILRQNITPSTQEFYHLPEKLVRSTILYLGRTVADKDSIPAGELSIFIRFGIEGLCFGEVYNFVRINRIIHAPALPILEEYLYSGRHSNGPSPVRVEKNWFETSFEEGHNATCYPERSRAQRILSAMADNNPLLRASIHEMLGKAPSYIEIPSQNEIAAVPR
ncbi:MAG: hypothetical protein KKB81_03175 [Candidatus Margulisbacteria bacterium]|nr:hypothetical protein [Candidatus Margulisiibacteriota bacterium]MBU1022247.1 hypothetical protein [Candidatus Margulisiibacteriota bacterium]MBU1729314.1 hypothetical protein [Candidatus Margulisiibacteriota bacterium]MBU1955587.1 hypothetical protein [Candidatus Margulisiibacteriota bacterium]